MSGVIDVLRIIWRMTAYCVWGHTQMRSCNYRTYASGSYGPYEFQKDYRRLEIFSRKVQFQVREWSFLNFTLRGRRIKKHLR